MLGLSPGATAAEIRQARNQLRLMGRGGGGQIEVHAVVHRFGIRDGDDIDADGDGVRPHEARGLHRGHPGSGAGRTPAERPSPEPAERRGRLGDGDHFGVSRGIAQLLPLIARGGDDRAVAHDDGANRRLARRGRLLGER